ncbi:MAG: hypothetical protein HQK96_08085 [Nitrospirae bacterium]|nr:hypothetical protein [Nitrospirota bacterium]
MVRFKADFPDGIPVKELGFLADFVAKHNGKAFFFDGEHFPTIKDVKAEIIKSGKIDKDGIGINSNEHCMELFYEAIKNLIERTKYA